MHYDSKILVVNSQQEQNVSVCGENVGWISAKLD